MGNDQKDEKRTPTDANYGAGEAETDLSPEK
jgi:hypothetical protein